MGYPCPEPRASHPPLAASQCESNNASSIPDIKDCLSLTVPIAIYNERDSLLYPVPEWVHSLLIDNYNSRPTSLDDVVDNSDHPYTVFMSTLVSLSIPGIEYLLPILTDACGFLRIVPASFSVDRLRSEAADAAFLDIVPSSTFGHSPNYHSGIECGTLNPDSPIFYPKYSSSDDQTRSTFTVSNARHPDNIASYHFHASDRPYKLGKPFPLFNCSDCSPRIAIFPRRIAFYEHVDVTDVFLNSQCSPVVEVSRGVWRSICVTKFSYALDPPYNTCCIERVFWCFFQNKFVLYIVSQDAPEERSLFMSYHGRISTLSRGVFGNASGFEVHYHSARKAPTLLWNKITPAMIDNIRAQESFNPPLPEAKSSTTLVYFNHNSCDIAFTKRNNHYTPILELTVCQPQALDYFYQTGFLSFFGSAPKYLRTQAANYLCGVRAALLPFCSPTRIANCVNMTYDAKQTKLLRFYLNLLYHFTLPARTTGVLKRLQDAVSHGSFPSKDTEQFHNVSKAYRSICYMEREIHVLGQHGPETTTTTTTESSFLGTIINALIDGFSSVWAIVSNAGSAVSSLLSNVCWIKDMLSSFIESVKPMLKALKLALSVVGLLLFAILLHRLIKSVSVLTGAFKTFTKIFRSFWNLISDEPCQEIDLEGTEELCKTDDKVSVTGEGFGVSTIGFLGLLFSFVTSFSYKESKEFLNSVGALSRSKGIIDDLITFCKDVVNWIYFRFSGNSCYYFKDSEIQRQCRDSYNTLLSLLIEAPDVAVRARTDQIWSDNFLNSSRDFRRCYYALIKDSTNGPEFKSMFDHVRTLVVTVRTNMPRATEPRPTVTVCILGTDPGCGKNSLATMIPAGTYSAIRSHYTALQQMSGKGAFFKDVWTDNRTFKKARTTPYWDGYNEMIFCLLIDEFLNQNDPKERAAEALEMMEQTDCYPVPLDMAAVDSKGIFFSSHFLNVITCPITDWNNSGINQPGAPARRMDIVLRPHRKNPLSHDLDSDEAFTIYSCHAISPNWNTKEPKWIDHNPADSTSFQIKTYNGEYMLPSGEVTLTQVCAAIADRYINSDRFVTPTTLVKNIKVEKITNLLGSCHTCNSRPCRCSQLPKIEPQFAPLPSLEGNKTTVRSVVNSLRGKRTKVDPNGKDKDKEKPSVDGQFWTYLSSYFSDGSDPSLVVSQNTSLLSDFERYHDRILHDPTDLSYNGLILAPAEAAAQVVSAITSGQKPDALVIGAFLKAHCDKGSDFYNFARVFKQSIDESDTPCVQMHHEFLHNWLWCNNLTSKDQYSELWCEMLRSSLKCKSMQHDLYNLAPNAQQGHLYFYAWAIGRMLLCVLRDQNINCDYFDDIISDYYFPTAKYQPSRINCFKRWCTRLLNYGCTGWDKLKQLVFQPAGTFIKDLLPIVAEGIQFSLGVCGMVLGACFQSWYLFLPVLVAVGISHAVRTRSPVSKPDNVTMEVCEPERVQGENDYQRMPRRTLKVRSRNVAGQNDYQKLPRRVINPRRVRGQAAHVLFPPVESAPEAPDTSRLGYHEIQTSEVILFCRDARYECPMNKGSSTIEFKGVDYPCVGVKSPIKGSPDFSDHDVLEFEDIDEIDLSSSNCYTGTEEFNCSVVPLRVGKHREWFLFRKGTFYLLRLATEGQAGTSSDHARFKTRSVANNIFQYVLTAKEGSNAGFCFSPGGRWFCMTRHQWEVVNQGADKVIEFAVQYHDVGNPLRFSRSDLVVTPAKDGRDLVTIYVKNRQMPQIRSLKPRLRSKGHKYIGSKVVRCSRIINGNKVEYYGHEFQHNVSSQTIPEINVDYPHVPNLTTPNHQIPVDYFYEIPNASGQAGNCMHMYVSADVISGSCDIIGAHFASHNGSAFVVPIWASDFPDLPEEEYDFLPGAYDVNPISVSGENCLYESFPAFAGTRQRGVNLKRKNFIPTKTELLPSPIHNELSKFVREELGHDIPVAPAPLTDFLNEKGDPVHVHANTFVKLAEHSGIDPMDEFIDMLITKYPDLILEGWLPSHDNRRFFMIALVDSLMSDDIEGLESMPRDSSPTYEFKILNKTRKHLYGRGTSADPSPNPAWIVNDKGWWVNPLLVCFIERLLKHVEAGGTIKCFADACWKDELRGLEAVMAGKTRMFCVGSFTLAVVTKMAFGDLIRSKHDLFIRPSKIGVNPYTEWSTMHQMLKKFPNIFGGDCSGWDYRLRGVFLYMLHKFIDTLDVDEAHRKLMHAVADSVMGCILIYGNYLLERLFMVPSGHWLTSYFNTFSNFVAHKIVWFYMKPPDFNDSFFTHVWMMFFGDDNGGCCSDVVAPWFNMQSIKFVFDKLGMGYTTPDKKSVDTDFLPLEEFSFLSRGFRLCPKTGHTFAPLNMDSIIGMLAYIREPAEGISLVSQLSLNVDIARYELVHHGKPVFDLFEPFLVAMRSEHRLTCPWPSYDLMLERALEPSS